jgi:hypothetical protein
VIGPVYAAAALPPGKWPPVLVERKGAKAPELPNGEERNVCPARRPIPVVQPLADHSDCGD